MGTECQKDYSDEDQALLDEAENATWGLPAGTIEAEMPTIQAALEVRYDQMMEAKNATIVEMGKDMTESGKSNFEIPPNVREEAIEEINRFAPTKTTCDERRAMREAGEELGISPARYIGTADITGFPMENVRQVMAILNHPEMPAQWTRRESIGQVRFEDRPDIVYSSGGIGGLTKRGEDGRMIGIFILPDEYGNVPPEQMLNGRIAHEVIHGNWSAIREYIAEHMAEFDTATADQISEHGLFPYPAKELSTISERQASAEIGEALSLTHAERDKIQNRLLKESVGEMSRFYFTDRSRLTPSATQWFGDMLNHFREH